MKSWLSVGLFSKEDLNEALLFSLFVLFFAKIWILHITNSSLIVLPITAGTSWKRLQLDGNASIQLIESQRTL